VKKSLSALKLGLSPIQNLLKPSKQSKNLLSAYWGIALSVIPIVVVLIVSDGMILGITNRYRETALYHFQIRSYGRDKIDIMDEELTETFSQEDWFTGGWMEHQSNGMVFTPQGKSAAFIRGVDPLWYKEDPRFQELLTIVEGRFDLSSSDNMVIGRELSKKLNVHVGDTIRLSTLRKLGNRVLPKITTFTVTGIISTGYRELDKLWLFIPYRKSIDLIGIDQGNYFFGLKVNKPEENLQEQVFRINQVLPVGYGAYSWYQLGYGQFKNFETTQILLLFIMGVIIVVATINISSSLIMIVIEDTREIGIIRALGGGPQFIQIKYLATGCILGFLGSLTGLIIGLFIGVNINWIIQLIEQVAAFFSIVFSTIEAGEYVKEELIWGREYYLEKIPVVINYYKLLSVFAFANFLTFVSTKFPARKAASLKPVEILHKH